MTPPRNADTPAARIPAADPPSPRPLPPWLEERVRLLSCRYGLLHHFDFDVPVGASLMQYGEWAQAELDALAPYVPRGGHVLDVGANAGSHAVAFARMVGPGGRVTALEPQVELFELLLRTVAANGLCEVVTTLRAGAGSRPGTAHVPRIAGQGRQNLGMVRLRFADGVATGGASGTAEVPVLRLDELRAAPAPSPGQAVDGRGGRHDGRVDLIKVDAEGMEADILLGAERTIRACRPVLHMECNDFAHAWPAARLALGWDYAVFHLRHAAFNPANHRGATRNIFGAAEEGALLCIPRERLESGALPPPCGTEVRDPADLARAVLETRCYGQPETDMPAARLDLALAGLGWTRAEELLADALRMRTATERPARRAWEIDRLRRALHGVRETASVAPSLAPGACSLAARPVLMVTHNWGGGTERHVQDLCDRLAAEGTPALVLRPRGNDAGCVWTVNLSQPLHLPNLAFDLPPDFGALLEVLADLNIGHIHVHNLAGYPHVAPELLPLVARLLEIPYDVTAHDLSALCPRITCIGPDGYPCPTALNEDGQMEGGAPWRCAACIAAETPQLGNTDIVRWRVAWATLLDGARAIFTPSRDTARRLAAHFPGCAARIAVRPHPETPPRTSPPATSVPYARGEPLRVAVIGAIGPHKGSHVLEDCARHAREAGLPLHFTVVGYTDRDDTLRELGVTITGRYGADELPGLLAANGGEPYHLAFLPAVWPETYSYTLSEAVLAGLYPVTFDLGAPAERMAAWGYGLRLATDLMRDPAAINAALLACATTPPPPPPPGLARAVLNAGDYPAPFRVSYYGFPDGGETGGNIGGSGATPAKEQP
ncbi:FkbM family methyltransferase [Nitratidesulfovibrio sp. D1]|uniref:FkbM family methyltransferase n=1 Tax=Nitratidesulfovibrio sp. D1 TaxID=3440151 RepID=UPI003EBF081A